jgi:hypothetical protein
MQKTIITCDHCGKKVPNDYHKNYALMFCNAASGNGDRDYLHACSREHLGFAVAKTFGIPIDGNLIAKLEAVSAHRDSLASDADERLTQLQEARKQIETLKQQLMHAIDSGDVARMQLAHTTPPPNVGGKTPADVASVAFARALGLAEDTTLQGSESAKAWDAAARAVLSAFAPNTTQAVKETLGRVRGAIAGLVACESNGTIRRLATLDIIDDELSALPAADLTGPKKPTKPLADHVHELGSCSFCEKRASRAIATNCTICGCPNERAFLAPCIANGKHNFEAP